MTAPRPSRPMHIRNGMPPLPLKIGNKGGSGELISARAARMQEALDGDVTVESLAKVAHADAAFAMKLLALVNSPAFTARSARTVTDINHAAALLGIRSLRTVALSLLVSSLCPAHESCRGLMANSLRRAVACRLIAKELGYDDLDGCFATGLFLDSGLLSHAQQKLELAIAIAASPPQLRIVREQVEGLVPHPLLGAQLAKKYALPDETVSAIQSHHAPEVPSGMLAQIAWLGEHVAGVFESPDVERARLAALSHARAIGLGSSSFESILDALPLQMSEVAGALGSDVGEVHDVDTLRNDASRLLSEINQQYEGVVRKLGELLAEKEKLTVELRKANESLATLACTDDLTRLPNRRALEDELSRAAARAARDGTWLSVVALDVDHFKRFNDAHGHAAGDAVLAAVGKILVQQCRKGDVPARYGGEEFTVVLPNTNPVGAAIAAERIRRAFESTPTLFESQPLKVSVSLGVASAHGVAAQPVEDLLARADEALYAAKRGGRNRVVCAGMPTQASTADDDDDDDDTDIMRVSALP